MKTNTIDTLILSYPRSGNHFVRYLIELLVGRPTLGLASRNDLDRTDSPIHLRPGIKYLSHVQGEPITRKQHGTHPHDHDMFKNLILIIRDPTECTASNNQSNPQPIIKNLNFFEKFKGKKDIIYYEDLISDIRPVIKTLEKFFDLHGTEDLLNNFQKYQEDSLGAPRRKPVSGTDPAYYQKRGETPLNLDHPLLARYMHPPSSPKLLIYIKTSPKHAGRQAAIQETWAQDFKDHGAQVFFNVSDPKVDVPTLEGDFLKLPGEDSHKGLVTRMIWLMQHVQDIDFTHLVTIDDDCSVNVPLFMTLPWKTAEMYGNNNGGYLAGCCTVWSKEATTKFKRWGSLEDVCVGQMAKWFNIKFTGSQNGAIRPWIKNNEDYILTENVAVQYYSRTPNQIRENHKISLTLNKK